MFRYLQLLLPFLLLLPTLDLGASQEPAPHPSQLIREGAQTLERELLQQLSLEDLEAFLSGMDPDLITLRSGEALSRFLDRKSLGLFEMPGFSIDGGGGTSNGDAFSLSGTIGQPDAGFSQGGTFEIFGGFKAAQVSILLFADGFESGDLSNWTDIHPDGPEEEK